MNTAAELSSSPASTGRKRLAAVVLAAAALGAVAGGMAASPANAATVQSGYPTVTQIPSPSPCSYLVSCPVATTFTFNHAGYYTYVYATFPQGATGTVSYRMHCADGFSKTKSVPISTYIALNMTVKDEHPGYQSCTMTQTVKKGFTTTAKLIPPDSDILWPEEMVQFTNS